MGRKREKKLLVPNSVHTRPREENSEENSKKFRNLFPVLCLVKTG